MYVICVYLFWVSWFFYFSFCWFNFTSLIHQHFFHHTHQYVFYFSISSFHSNIFCCLVVLLYSLWLITRIVFFYYSMYYPIRKRFIRTLSFPTKECFLVFFIIIQVLLYFTQIFALILSVSGVVLFAYADGFGSHSTWGVVLAIASSSALTIFKVLSSLALR